MILLIHGSDNFSSFNRAKEVFMAEAKRFENPEVFNEDFSEKGLEDFFQIVEGQTLFSNTKIALIKCLTQNSRYKDSADQIIERLAKIPDETSLILWESQKIASNTKLGKFFKNQKKEEVFEVKKRNEVRQIAKVLLQNAGVKIDSDAFETFLFLTNYDLGYITSEVEKLKLLSDKTITKETIKSIVPNSSESLIWDLTDAIIESDKSKAIRAADDLMKHESDSFMLIPMIGRQIKIMIQIKKQLEDGTPYQELASKLRLPPFIIGKVAKYVQNAEMAKLKKLFIKLVDMDFAIKTGRMDINTALTLFLSLV